MTARSIVIDLSPSTIPELHAGDQGLNFAVAAQTIETGC